MARTRTSAADILALEREEQALELRSSKTANGRRMGYREIAEVMNMTPGGVHAAVKRAMGRLIETITETAEQVRFQDLQDLDAMTDKLTPLALGGDIDAAKIVIKVQERRSKLLGLDAPTRQHITTMTHEEAMQQLDDPDKSE